MSLEFAIRNPKECYTNGDFIEGDLILTVQGPLDVKSISVELNGTSFVKIVVRKTTHRHHYGSSHHHSSVGHQHYRNVPYTNDHVFLDQVIQLFTPPGQYGDYCTMVNGRYVYSFRFQIPNRTTALLCRSTKIHFNDYANEEPDFNQFTLPASQAVNHYSDHSKIVYSLRGTVDVKGFFKSDKVIAHGFAFRPTAQDISFPFGHMLRKYNGTICFGLCDYANGHIHCSKNKEFIESKGFFSRLVASKTEEFEFAFQTRFISCTPIQTPLGPSGRIIPLGINLRDVVSIFMISSMTYEDLMELLHMPPTHGGEALIITAYTVVLAGVTHFYASGYNRCVRDPHILKKADNVSLPIELDKMTPVDPSRAQQFDGVTLKRYKDNNPVMREAPLPWQINDLIIPTNLPLSHIVCNSKCEYYLEYVIEVCSSSKIKHTKTIKLSSAVTIVDKLPNTTPTPVSTFDNSLMWNSPLASRPQPIEQTSAIPVDTPMALYTPTPPSQHSRENSRPLPQAPQQSYYESSNPSSQAPQQPYYGSVNPASQAPQQPYYGSVNPASQAPQQPYYGSVNPASQAPQQPYYGSVNPASQAPQQPYYGSVNPVSQAPQQPYYGSNPTAQNPQQSYYGSGNNFQQQSQQTYNNAPQNSSELPPAYSDGF